MRRNQCAYQLSFSVVAEAYPANRLQIDRHPPANAITATERTHAAQFTLHDNKKATNRSLKSNRLACLLCFTRLVTAGGGGCGGTTVNGTSMTSKPAQRRTQHTNFLLG